MEITPEVNNLYQKLLGELKKFGEITVEEKKTSFHIKGSGRHLPVCIPAKPFSFSISWQLSRSKVSALWNRSRFLHIDSITASKLKKQRTSIKNS